jgi:predicted nucleic acid-binding protein
MPEPIIIDTSSLIALERINLLQILCNIYKEVVIPESVIKEFGNLSLSCLSIRKVESNLLKLLILATTVVTKPVKLAKRIIKK